MPWLLENSERILVLTYRNHFHILIHYFCFYLCCMALVFCFSHHFAYKWFKRIHPQIIPESPKMGMACSTPVLCLSYTLVFPPKSHHSLLFLKHQACFHLRPLLHPACNSLLSIELQGRPLHFLYFSQKSTYWRGHL